VSRPGRRPNTPQKCDGQRIEPLKSEPRPSAVIALASAAASPPDEPPAERVTSWGLPVAPDSSL
jgi:hypothetical protein